MDYIRNSENGQLVFTQSTKFLRIPSCLYGFMNHSTTTEMTASGRTAFCFHGELDASGDDITCQCGCRMHVNNHPEICSGQAFLQHFNLKVSTSSSCLTWRSTSIIEMWSYVVVPNISEVIHRII